MSPEVSDLPTERCNKVAPLMKGVGVVPCYLNLDAARTAMPTYKNG